MTFLFRTKTNQFCPVLEHNKYFYFFIYTVNCYSKKGAKQLNTNGNKTQMRQMELVH